MPRTFTEAGDIAAEPVRSQSPDLKFGTKEITATPKEIRDWEKQERAKAYAEYKEELKSEKVKPDKLKIELKEMLKLDTEEFRMYQRGDKGYFLWNKDYMIDFDESERRKRHLV